MGFRRTDEEVSRMAEYFSNSRFLSERVTVRFRTDREVLERILPPGLEPGDDLIVNAEIGRRSSSVGIFTIGNIWVSAKYGDRKGLFILAMIVDRFDPAKDWGRETFGEPKKIGVVELVKERHRDRLLYRGYVERHGVRLMEIQFEADSVQSEPPSYDSGDDKWIFCTKAQLGFDGRGLAGDAELIGLTEMKNNTWERHKGRGLIKLQGTVHDPFDELVVREIVECSTSLEESFGQRKEILATIPQAEYLPYHYGRLDDYSALNSLLVPELKGPCVDTPVFD